ncbi:MAG TPA: spore coat protein CotJB [Firmicutes bacterium]|nr:spore coat protein CotJB [Bacillota bacterium]
MSDRLSLLRRIMELQFTATDLNLFLDTHPDDQRALADYNATVQELRTAVSMYEMRYGPLINYGFSESSGTWRWVDEPWPWEIVFEGGI